MRTRAPLLKLSRRERQMLVCLAHGLSNQGIADHLGLREHTVKNYLSRTYDKLGVDNRLAALVWYVHHPDFEISHHLRS